MTLRLQLARTMKPDIPVECQACYAFLDCGRKGNSLTCGIWLLRTHDDNYVQIRPHEIPEIFGVEEILLSLALTTIYIQPGLEDMAWWEVDKYPTVKGLVFETGLEEFLTIEYDSLKYYQIRVNVVQRLLTSVRWVWSVDLYYTKVVAWVFRYDINQQRPPVEAVSREKVRQHVIARFTVAALDGVTVGVASGG
jgi:hypothetical protein